MNGLLLLLITGFLVRINVVDTAGNAISNAVIYIEGKDRVIGEGDFVALPNHSVLHISAPGYETIVETLSISHDTTFTFTLHELLYKTEEVQVVSSPIYSTSGQVKIQNNLMVRTTSPIIPDPFRALINLPFVETFNEILPFALYIKGGLPGENALFLEGFPLIFPFHFGFASAIPINVIDYYDFYTVSIPPEFSIKVSSAVNFHLRNDRVDEIFVDPASSVTFIHSRKKFLSSFRLTSMSLPFYLMSDKKLFYSFFDIITRYKNLFFYYSLDRYFDKKVENSGWRFSNIMCGYKWGKSNFYITAGNYRGETFADSSVFQFFSDIKMGLTVKPGRVHPGVNFILTHFVSHSDEQVWWNSNFNILETDVWHELKNPVKMVGMIKFLYTNKVRVYLTPKIEWVHLWKKGFFRISTGSLVQPDVSTNDNLVSIVPERQNKVTRDYYLQIENQTERLIAGAYLRYFPHEFFFLELAKEEPASPGDTLYNIVTYDTLVEVSKYVAGIYATLIEGGKWWNVGTDFAVNYGVQKMGEVWLPEPFSSRVSFKLSPSIRWRSNTLSFLFIFRSSGKEPVFYEVKNGKLVVYKKPELRPTGIYLRMDVNYIRRIRIFGREGKVVLGIFNLVGIKPDVSTMVGEDRYLRFPVPSAGLWIRLQRR